MSTVPISYMMSNQKQKHHDYGLIFILSFYIQQTSYKYSCVRSKCIIVKHKMLYVLNLNEKNFFLFGTCLYEQTEIVCPSQN